MDDPASAPEHFADEFTDASYSDPHSVIAAAKLIHISEIAKDPSLRKEIRKAFRLYGAISVRPTDKGAQKIDELHPYYVRVAPLILKGKH